jgi:ATP-dependent Lhr-like helicase
VQIIDAGAAKNLELRIEVPIEDMSKVGRSEELPPALVEPGNNAKSIWPSVHPRVLELIRSHRTTLIFVNSRRLAERFAAALNELAGEEIVRAHHGSVAREQRMAIEEELKAGRLPAIVATSSLELGRQGSIDLVIQVESPPSVAAQACTNRSCRPPDRRTQHRRFVSEISRRPAACAALTSRMVAGRSSCNAIHEMRLTS